MAAIIDLHPDDHAERIALRTELVRLRVEEHRLSQRDFGAVYGIDQGGVGRLERTDQWLMRTVQRWSRKLKRELLLQPVGFPPPAVVRTLHPTKSGDLDGLLSAIISGVKPTNPDQADSWRTSMWQHELAGIRCALDVTQKQMGRALGNTVQAVSDFESGNHGSRLIIMQRYARALARIAGRPHAHLTIALRCLPDQEKTPDAPTDPHCLVRA